MSDEQDNRSAIEREQDRLAEIGDMKRDQEIDKRAMESAKPLSDPNRTRFEQWISDEPFAFPTTRNSENPAVSSWPSQYKEWIVQVAWESWNEALRGTKDVQLRVLLHEFSIVSMRIRTDLKAFEESGEITHWEQQWLKEVEWLIDAAKEYPLSKVDLEAWEAKKKTKRWEKCDCMFCSGAATFVIHDGTPMGRAPTKQEWDETIAKHHEQMRRGIIKE